MIGTQQKYNPARFFLIAYAVTWVCWFAAAYSSTRGGSPQLLGLLVFLGLCGPLVAALILLWQAGPELWRDFVDRLVSTKRIDPRFLPLILFLVPVVMVIAIGISLLFGASPDQFGIRLGPAFATVPALIGLFLAPAFEEAGWRGYGMDSLRSRYTLFMATLAFALLWAFWHVPLFFIAGFYHNSLLANGPYTVNFFVSVLAMAFIISWVFYRNNRSIVACFLFHLSANVAMSYIPAEPFTKCIVSVLLLAVAAVIVVADRERFFHEPWAGPV